MEPMRFEANGAELHISPDPTGVVVKVYLTGALLGLSRTITLSPALARDLAEELNRKAAIAAGMARSVHGCE